MLWAIGSTIASDVFRLRKADARVMLLRTPDFNPSLAGVSTSGLAKFAAESSASDLSRPLTPDSIPVHVG